MDYDEYLDKVRELSSAMLEEERVALMMAFRFMDSALWQMPMEPYPEGGDDISRMRREYWSESSESEAGFFSISKYEPEDPATGLAKELAKESSYAHPFSTMSTSGTSLRFDPERVIKAYRVSECELARDLLHAVMHCVLRHPFDKNHENVAAWSLACDVVTETIAIEMCRKRFPSQWDDERVRAAEQLKARIGVLTPFKLYQLFDSLEPGVATNPETGMSAALMGELYQLFARDTHDSWANFPRPEDEGGQQEGPNKAPVDDAQRMNDLDNDDDDEGSAGAQAQPDEDKDGEQPVENEDLASEGEDSSEDADVAAEDEDDANDDGEADEADEGSGEDDEPSDEDDDEDDQTSFEDDDLTPEQEQAEQEWRDISKRMQTDLQSFSQSLGDAAQALMSNLAVANRKPANYGEFLRKFATMAEEMMVNDDEFDYIFYTYGMDTYGNMPLIEPLEYKDDKRVREFVIALDTSGSCSGRLIKGFVSRTFDILSSSQNYGQEINVHIVQCDSTIQSDTKVTSLRQLEEYRDSFWVKGFGTTDFRPVFDYVDGMLEAGEFQNLRGLLYFTDGLGTYPASPPAYDTAFIFLDDDAQTRTVPPWAMKVVMDTEEMEEFSS